VLFTTKPDWEPGIKNRLTAAIPFFYPPEQVSYDWFDYVIPLTLDAIRYLNRNHRHLVGKNMIVPTTDAVDLCNDKLEFSNFFIDRGFGDLIPARCDSSFPYILKKRISEWGIDSVVVLDKSRESQLRGPPQVDEYFTQQFVQGNCEFTSHIVISGGKILMLKTVEFTFDSDFYIKGRDKAAVSRKIVDHGELVGLFEDVLNLIGFDGICCFNYKIVDSRLKIFEINPRYGASPTLFVNDVLAALKLAVHRP